MRGLLAGLALIGGVVVATSSCVVELNHVVACGDGYVDPEAGEECEPGLEDSFADACDDVGIVGVAGCDLETCTFTCVGCGDGIVQDASDGELLAEECDVGQAGPTTPRECAGFVDPLEPWRAGKPYASGTSSVCTAACYYDRSTCSYCGNGVADGQTQLAPDLANQGDVESLAENCDGESLSAELIATSGCPTGSEPNVVCAADCQTWTYRDDVPKCCISAGQPCEDPALCCHAYAHPGDTLHCENPLTGNTNGVPGAGGSTCR